ncbi:TPA: adenylosuccinate lyase [candidate division WOR-3 bacterium]|jgi:adenylosuccinate lyase|uniref:Adenylosuccinate lyase n=1 Tax=candidate division WOR-3 bacterium TaxID=2052148 RepID=A0A350H9R7_UNCW3|nr:adenylosuccinate lyase [candidate division WOR-3 bacterium]
MIKRYSRESMERIWSDENKFDKFLEVEIAVLKAYSKKGVISRSIVAEIEKKAGYDIKRVNEIEKKTKHDVIAFLTAVGEKVGRYSKYIHMGMTSSDMIDTANALILRDSIEEIIRGAKKFRNTIYMQAKKYKDTAIVGRTHGVHAEPTSVGLKMLVWVDDLDRCITMFEKTKDGITRGKISGAVGNYANIDPKIEELALKELKIARAEISSQIVSRDVYADYLYLIARMGAVIEKIALQVRLLQRTETREFEEPFTKGQKGSSAMPHKRNPVTCEQMCGLARVLRGNLQSAMENIALWDERDISHSSVERIILPDSSILIDYMMDKMDFVIGNLSVYEKNTEKNFERSFNLLFSQRVLLSLLEKGLMRENAYAIVQNLAMRAWDEGRDFEALVLDDREVKKYLNRQEIILLFDKKHYLKKVNEIFSRFKKLS